MKRVMMVGSAEESGGGVSSVIKLMKKMPVWEKYSCYWLGTQIQRNYLWKLWYAIRAYVVALCIIWRYDIIHFHTTPDKGGLVIQFPIMLMAKFLRKKTIVHVHMGNQLKYHKNNTFFVWWLKRCDKIILLANKWKNLVDEFYPLFKDKTTVVYNAFEIMKKIPLGEKENIIVLMAHMIEDKGIDVMLDAWNVIHERHKDWHVYMMGSGEYLRYQQKAFDMGLSNSMTFTGYITGKKKKELLSHASISVMCSYNEGFPMVVLEGWAYSHAVVTTPVGGLPDVIEEGKNCLVFNFGNYEMLAEHLERLMEDKVLREHIASYSRDYGEKVFSLETISESLSKLYSEI